MSMPNSNPKGGRLFSKYRRAVPSFRSGGGHRNSPCVALRLLATLKRPPQLAALFNSNQGCDVAFWHIAT